MIAYRFIVTWDDLPVGIAYGRMFKTIHPSQIRYWSTFEEAQQYANCEMSYLLVVKQIHFKIVDLS